MTQILFERLRDMYVEAVLSPSYQEWRREARRAWAFYDGDQWTADEVQRLTENGQPVLVVNKIAAKIDNIAGTEISSRTRILYRSRSGVESEERTARILSDLALYVAERGDQPIEISNVFRAGLVTGIGWMDIGVERAAGDTHIFCRCEDEMSVIWDPNSRRLDFSDANFVARERDLDDRELRQLFMSAEAGFEAASAWRGLGVFDPGAKPGLTRVVELQYKTQEPLFTYRAPSGDLVHSFEELPPPYQLQEEAQSTRVYVAYLTGNALLEHRPLGYASTEFTLIPFVFKRRREDGRPYGLVKTAIDPQRELNKRRSKAMHILSTAQVIADVDAVDDPNLLAREAARPDGLILKRPGKDLRIERNTDLAATQVRVMEQAAQDIQDVMGVFDEAIGRHSNAVSGVAIQTRQVASTMNQMFAFDALRRTKKRLGLIVLHLIRQFFTAEKVIRITDRFDGPRILRLNTAEPDSLNLSQIQVDDYDVSVEEVPDVMTSRELDLSQLTLLKNAGVPIPPHVLVEATSLRRKDELIAYLRDEAQTV
jgi:hypothetical protein